MQRLRFLVFLAFAVPVTCAAAACGGEQETVTASSSNLDGPCSGEATGTDGGADGAASEEGAHCSGTSTGAQCAPGFICGLFDTPGAGGVCIPVPDGQAAEGAYCSGTSTGAQCAPGLTCGLFDTPGAGGVCIVR